MPTTAPETIEQYSIRVAEAWKIGRKKVDDGAILLVAKNDRKLRIEVGYGLEGALTDVTVQAHHRRDHHAEIQERRFCRRDFRRRRPDHRAWSTASRCRRRSRSGHSGRATISDFLQFLNPFNPFTIIIVLVLGGVFRSVFGRLFGSVATGGLVAIVAWFIFGSLILSGIAGVIASAFTMFSDSITAADSARKRRRLVRRLQWSSWGGSFSGGSSSSDSGGFSGGGGSFGWRRRVGAGRS